MANAFNDEGGFVYPISQAARGFVYPISQAARGFVYPVS